MISQPENVLSAKHTQLDAMEARLTMLKREVELQPVYESIIKRNLEIHLNELVLNIQDEIVHKDE